VSKGKARGKRKLVIWGLAVSALIIIIVVYETSKELKRDGAESNVENTANSQNAAVPVEKAQAILKSYYRSHNLPLGWNVGETEIATPERLEVTLYFAPRIGDSRHGRPAPPGDIHAANACPLDDKVSALVAHFSLRILVHDKTGLIDSIACS
jgi:hypothetical protein